MYVRGDVVLRIKYTQCGIDVKQRPTSRSVS